MGCHRGIARVLRLVYVPKIRNRNTKDLPRCRVAFASISIEKETQSTFLILYYALRLHHWRKKLCEEYAGPHRVLVNLDPVKEVYGKFGSASILSLDRLRIQAHI